MSQLKTKKIQSIVKDLVRKTIHQVAEKHDVSPNVIAHIAKGNSYSDVTGFIPGAYTLTDYRQDQARAAKKSSKR